MSPAEPESEPTSTVDDILADAAERSAERKRETVRTPDEFKLYSEVDGIYFIDLNVRIPNTYYQAIKEYCKVAKIPTREWFNEAIIRQTEKLGIDYARETFVKQYHLGELSREQLEAMIQADRRFTMVEETLSDA